MSVSTLPSAESREHDMSSLDSEVLQTRRIEVVDEQNRVRLVLGLLRRSEGAEGAFGLSILDTTGRVRVWLALEETGPTLVFDESGNAVLQLGVDDPSPDSLRTGSFLHLGDAAGRPVLSWQVDSDGTLTVRPYPEDH
jgi:hypothetical protein